MPTAPIVRSMKKRYHIVWADEQCDPFFTLLDQYCGESFAKLEQALKQLPIRGVNRTLFTTLFALQKKQIPRDETGRMDFWQRVSEARENLEVESTYTEFSQTLSQSLPSHHLDHDWFADAFPHTLITKSYCEKARAATCLAFNRLQIKRLQSTTRDITIDGVSLSWSLFQKQTFEDSDREIVFHSSRERYLTTEVQWKRSASLT